jgi:hypothetical protein
VRQIRSLLQYDCEVHIQHSYREATRGVDMLGNIGCDRGGTLIFMSVVRLILVLCMKLILLGLLHLIL